MQRAPWSWGDRLLPRYWHFQDQRLGGPFCVTNSISITRVTAVWSSCWMEVHASVNFEMSSLAKVKTVWPFTTTGHSLIYSSVKTVVWGTFLIKNKIKDWKDCSESTGISCRIWCPVWIPGFTLWKERPNLHKLFSDLHKHTVAWARTHACTHTH